MPTDSEPMGRGQAAAHRQFLTLFLRSEREVFRYVAALVPNVADAEDIVQQTALALWEKFDAYDPTQPFTPWACRFALNVTRRWIERQQRWRTLLAHGLAEELARRREELEPERERRLAHLERCVAKLPDDQQGLLRGYYYERKNVETLAVEMQRTVDATYKLLQRVRQALQRCVETAARQEEARS